VFCSRMKPWGALAKPEFKVCAVRVRQADGPVAPASTTVQPGLIMSALDRKGVRCDGALWVG